MPNINLSQKSINLDLQHTGYTNTIYAQQDDINSRKLTIYLFDDGKNFNIPEDATVSLCGTRADDTVIYRDVNSFQRNVVTIDFENAELAAKGIAKYKIEIKTTTEEGQTQLLTSSAFKIKVYENIYDEDGKLASPQYSDLQRELDKVHEVTQKAVDATTDLQNKLDNHHFVLTEDKDVANGVPSLDSNAKIPINELYEATTSNKGITQLTDSVTSTSTTTAATPKSVKTTYDAVVTEKNRATNAENTITDNLNGEIERATASENNINETLTSHITNKSNPHNVTKTQIGLGNVDNTSDINKPVSTAQQSAIDLAYSNSNGYTDTKIADLINGAPSTLDTLGEIAAAMAENKNVVDALNEAIGIKANQSELDTHTGNNTIHITSTERANWNSAKTHADSAHAPSNAQANVIETVKVNGTALTPSSKSVNITVPTNNNQLTNGAGYITSSGTAKTISDTLPISKGGTGQTTAQEAANSFINALTTGTATPTDADYYVCQYVGGGTTQTTYHRRPMSSLWEYIKSKNSSVLGLTSSSYTGNSATATKLATARTIALTGSVTGSGTFDGSGNLSISTTTNHTHSYAGSPSSGGSANSAITLDGFTNNSAGFWSLVNTIPKTGTCIKRLDTSGGGGLCFSEHDAILDQIIDGKFYQDEGRYEVIDSNSISEQSVKSAATATALTTSAGSATQPVYFSSGKPVACTYTLGKSVPSDALFTDTTYSAATTSANGLMTVAMVTKLNGIASGANNYTLPTASSTLGGVKTTSTVTSTSGLSPCPIISGVPYYKDANTTSDYEEGTWTPIYPSLLGDPSSVYYFQEGNYVKLGKIVFVTCVVVYYRAEGTEYVYIDSGSFPYTISRIISGVSSQVSQSNLSNIQYPHYSGAPVSTSSKYSFSQYAPPVYITIAYITT